MGGAPSCGVALLVRVPLDVEPRRGAAHALQAVPVVTGLPWREREISPFEHMDSAYTGHSRDGHEVDARRRVRHQDADDAARRSHRESGTARWREASE